MVIHWPTRPPKDQRNPDFLRKVCPPPLYSLYKDNKQHEDAETGPPTRTVCTQWGAVPSPEHDAKRSQKA